MPSYDANTSGNYVFTGTLVILENITNTNNLTATVNVVVAQQPVTEETPTATTDVLQNASSSLLNGVFNFVKGAISKITSLSILQKIGFGLSEGLGVLKTQLLTSVQQAFGNLFGK